MHKTEISPLFVCSVGYEAFRGQEGSAAGSQGQRPVQRNQRPPNGGSSLQVRECTSFLSVYESYSGSHLDWVNPRSRSKDIVEPLMKPQWYVSCTEMGKQAADAVREGRLKIVPDHHLKTWFNWMDNIR